MGPSFRAPRYCCHVVISSMSAYRRQTNYAFDVLFIISLWITVVNLAARRIRYNSDMAILVMLGWWYSRGWLWILNATSHRLRVIGRTFAVKVLLRTWFSPWKQIYRQSTFRNFFSIALDNAVSRTVGTVVRTSILFCALWLGIGSVIFGLVSLVIWPFLPLLIIILPILSLSAVTF